MPIEFIAINLILILAVLFIVFDTIKRIKGKFNRGCRVLFLGFFLLFILNFIELLDKLNFLRGVWLGEILEVIFIVAILVSVVIINKKVREVSNHHKKRK